MSRPDDEYEVLISAYLDGELDAASQRRLEEAVQRDPALRREYDAMRALTRGTTLALRASGPPPDAWDGFVDGVYDRIERTAGWALLGAGAAALAAYGGALFALAPEIPLAFKLLIAVPAAGLTVLFVSVLRQRLRSAKRDRYAKEVYR